MGDDSCLRGRGFEIQQHIMDGHFFGLICCKNCIVCMKRPKMNNKVAEVCTFKKNWVPEYAILEFYIVCLK